MKILLISAYFPPEVGSASHLFYDLGREFVRHGHSVSVLTGYPSYNIDPEKLEEKYRRGVWLKESVEGMDVLRVRAMEMPRNIPVLRGIGQFMMALSFGFEGFLHLPATFDMILMYSPPLFLGLPALFLRRISRAKLVINIQDLFPQSAIDLGILRNDLLIRIFRGLESFLYRHADLITVHSPGNKEHVLRCGGFDAKTVVVPNLIDTNALRPGPRENNFRKRYGIANDMFIVSFGGVIGYSQDLDVVIDAADRLRDISNIVFLIVGDGSEKARLMKRAEGKPNIRFFPMLAKDEYAELMHASDVGLVTLKKSVKTPVVPSKILSIMAAGRPLIACMPMDGDAPVIIGEAKCGYCIPPEDPENFAAVLRRMYERPEEMKAFGCNGRKYVEDHFSLEICAALYENLFDGLLLQERNGNV